MQLRLRLRRRFTSKLDAVWFYLVRLIGAESSSASSRILQSGSTRALDPRPLINLPARWGDLVCQIRLASGCSMVPRSARPEAARFYHHWPHEYRTRVLYASEQYRYWLDACNLEDLRWCRIIRSPYKRAVSGYRHALRWEYKTANMSRVLGWRFADEIGFSFQDFLDYLACINVKSCNLHHRQQYHPIENSVHARQCGQDRRSRNSVVWHRYRMRFKPRSFA